MPHIQINHTEFYYEVHGKGYPLVLVAGYASDHVFWLPVLRALEQDFKVLIFDHRAVGQTKDKDIFPLTADIMADDVIKLIRALGFSMPHVVGQSMGGTVVQSLAARYPGEINKLVILNSTLKWRQAMLLGLKSILNAQRENCHFDTVYEMILSWVYGEAFLSDPEKTAILRSLFLNNPYPQSLHDQERQYAALAQFDGHAHLHKIKAPTLVVYGREDIISLPDESKEIAQGIVQAKLVELPCGHGITAEVPEKLGALLKDFL